MLSLFKKSLLILFVVLSFSPQASAKAQAEEKRERPVYFLAQIKITDKDKFFNEYVPEVKKHIKAAGGEIIFGGIKPLQQLEGSWEFFTIAIKFPSKVAHDEFYFSEGNLNIAVPIRHQSSTINNIMLF